MTKIQDKPITDVRRNLTVEEIDSLINRLRDRYLDNPDIFTIRNTNNAPITHNIEFGIGQMVYLITDKEQCERMVTAIILRPQGTVEYLLSIGAAESWHFSIEISVERDIVKATT